MVNLEHKLTVDDLIVEYMMYKVKNGYDPSFTTAEFITFLYFFESKMEVKDASYNNNELFKKFFERKSESDWSRVVDYKTMEKVIVPHMEMEYSEKEEDYLIKANYKLSDFDKSTINTYFMDNGMSRFEHFKGQTSKIRSIIGEWLENYPKRKIDESIEINEHELMIGKYVTTEIIINIWDSYINDQIKKHKWPKQCTDINKYLFKLDLAEIIELQSIRIELIDLYNILSKRIAILYHQDKNLHISTYTNSYLARANYELIIRGYEKIIDNTFGNGKKSLDIDLSTLTFKESHEIDGFYDLDEDTDVKTTTTKIGSEKTRKLVKILDDSVCNK